MVDFILEHKFNFMLFDILKWNLSSWFLIYLINYFK